MEKIQEDADIGKSNYFTSVSSLHNNMCIAFLYSNTPAVLWLELALKLKYFSEYIWKTIYWPS